MNRFARLALGLAALLAPATGRAHYLWVTLESAGPPVVARVGLGETHDTTDATLDGKIRRVRLAVDGRPAELGSDEEGLVARLDADPPGCVEARCDYGVLERHGETFALVYGARAQTRPLPPSTARAGDGLRVAWVEGDSGTALARVTWDGEPLAGASLKVFRDEGEPAEVRADGRGEAAVAGLADGRAALLVRHVESAPGRRDGRSFGETRHYATLTVAPASHEPTASESDADAVLRRAHEARANWGPGFPGFSADLAVRSGEREARGTVRVSPEGEVALDMPDGPAKEWARRQLRSIVMHRGLRGPTRLSPGAKFLEPESSSHPLGRLIELAGDGMGSAYRIRGDEITEVNRTMGRDRFTNRVLANARNAEGRLLPLAYTVAHWDDPSGRLERVETYHATWTRVGRLDLPAVHTQVVAEDGASAVRQLELTNHRLLDDAPATAAAPR